MTAKTAIYGVGINDLPTRIKIDGVHTTCYVIWRGMLQRCYSKSLQAKYPTYVGCTVDSMWHRLSVFKAWFDENYRPGFDLDKDILVQGNKVYGPDTCVFVPHRINGIMLDSVGRRGDLPRGVSRNGTGYVAGCANCDGYKNRRTFRTVEEADAWYRAMKGIVIRRAATDALANREIDLRTHLALLRHAVLIEFG